MEGWKEKDFWLTKKQKAHADKYLETWNATQAALEVYDTTDYSTAWNIASDNLKKPKIRAYLEDKWEIAGKVIQTIMESGDQLLDALYLFLRLILREQH